jgi:excisionase family DNA binding protein
VTRIEAAVAELVEAIRAEVSAAAAPPAPDRLVTVDEAAHLLGLGRTSIYELMASGDLPFVKIGRARRIPSRAVTQLTAGPQARSD